MLRNRFINTTALCFEGEGNSGGNNTPAPVTAPWGADANAQWMLGEVGKQQPWYEALPDGATKEFYREKKYGNPLVAADANYSAHRMVNGNAIEMPGLDAPPEKWGEFTAKLRGDGVKAPADYKFDFGKDAAGKDIAPDPRLLSFAQQLAYDLGVPAKRAQELIVNKWQAFAKDTNGQAHNDMVAANTAEAEAVKTKWGANFDTLRAAGERAVKALGLDPTELTKIEGAIGAAPMLNLFAKLGSISAEGGLPSGDPSKQADPSNMSPQQADAEANRMRADPAISKALQDKNDPQHIAMTQKLEQLYKLMAAPAKGA